MKKILFVIFTIVLFSIFISGINNDPKAIISKLAKKGDLVSGELSYRVSLFGVIPAAEAVFSKVTLKDFKGKKVYHLNVLAVPLKLYSRFFNGSVTLDSYIDAVSLKPLLFKQKLQAPGKENPNKEVFYDQDKLTMSLGGVTRSILDNTHDPLSVIFNLMRMNFSNIKELQLNINTNQKNYILKAHIGQKGLLIDGKKEELIFIKADIKRRDNEPYHRSSLDIVLLKREENIPVLIKVFASGALITARLTDIKQ